MLRYHFCVYVQAYIVTMHTLGNYVKITLYYKKYLTISILCSDGEHINISGSFPQNVGKNLRQYDFRHFVKKKHFLA